MSTAKAFWFPQLIGYELGYLHLGALIAFCVVLYMLCKAITYDRHKRSPIPVDPKNTGKFDTGANT